MILKDLSAKFGFSKYYKVCLKSENECKLARQEELLQSQSENHMGFV